ncbi:glycosyltransferase [Polaribacter aestuariivivens]|uniref:Glycosyltransferase n=1 Tax=Polaribacter aestuariivivens TaxID=2304626 RepID=A0A5S3N1C0_9FLAO|nr:glycosyltransferase [Polaribacter aestuariivivens]TMM29148.1 glycosyltransferase [Polaribacter aestuariivivens]
MLTIVTPTLNSVNFLENNINSIKKLTIPFEHIIVDGGSSDGTLEIIKKHPHVKLINQTEKLGMYHAISLGFEKAKGEFITWVNSDDVVVKEGFEKMYEVLKSNKCDFVYSDSIFNFIKKGKKTRISGSRFPKFILKNKIMPFVQPSTMYTKNLYEKIGGLNYLKFKLAGDLDMFRRFSIEKGIRFKYLNIVSTEFLKYGESLGDINIKAMRREVINMEGKTNVLSKIIIRIILLMR